MATVMCCIWVLIYWYSYGHIRKQYHQVGYALETFPALSKIIVTYSKYRLFNVLCWLWNIYEGAELPSVYFITNTKHCITYLALTQLFPVLVPHPEMNTLGSILLLFVPFLL